MNMAKDILKAYRQQKEEIIKTEEAIANLSKRKEAIEQEIISQNDEFVNAESVKKKTLEQFVLGEVLQSEVEKIKKLSLQFQQMITDNEEIISVIGKKVEEFQQQLTDLRYKLRDTEKLLWQAIANDLATKIRDSIGTNVEKWLFACQQGRLPIHGNFFNELFRSNLTLSPERAQKIRNELAKEYEI